MVAQILQRSFTDLALTKAPASKPDRFATMRLYRAIRDRCWLDHALVYGDYRLEHRTPEDMGRNFYALLWRDWLVGIEHYQRRAASIEKVQWGVAAVLLRRGWQPLTIEQVYCEDEWSHAAHRMPRLLKGE